MGLMAKTLNTLVADIYDVLSNDKNHKMELPQGAEFAAKLLNHYQNAVSGRRDGRQEKVLRASEIGKPCTRQIAYDMSPAIEPEPMPGHTLYKFMYGNMIEELTLQLARSAGHEVWNEQGKVVANINGLPEGWVIKGSMDAIIDGRVVDVKSASGFAFKKFTEQGVTPQTDTFGYAKQIQFYHNYTTEAVHEDPAFLFVNKELGKLEVVSVADQGKLPLELAILPRVHLLDEYIKGDKLPPKLANAEVPEGASGNMKLCTACSYCSYKKHCWPKARVFAYSSGPVWLTQVKREPKVMEITK